MATFNKVQIDQNTYDISSSPNGGLQSESDGFISDDTVDHPTSYTSVEPITTSEVNKNIFQKITSMIRNIRFIGDKIGNTVLPFGTSIKECIIQLPEGFSNKALVNHTHEIEDLPVINALENNSNLIPRSWLISDLNDTLNARLDYIDKLMNMPSFTTNTDCGGIPKGTYIDKNNIEDVLKKLLIREFNHKLIDTWNSLTDVNAFFTKHTPENGWAGLQRGNYVRINASGYESDWVILGFDCEHNQTAADNTIYDNGYGLCLVRKPRDWNSEGNWLGPWGNTTSGGYISSLVHQELNSTIYQALYTICGSHIINRNVLLSDQASSQGNNYRSSSYTWTTAYLTLLSKYQRYYYPYPAITTQYDIGEANYEFELTAEQREQIFGTNSESYLHWIRDISYLNTGSTASGPNGGGSGPISNNLRIVPMMYLR